MLTHACLELSDLAQDVIVRGIEPCWKGFVDDKDLERFIGPGT